MDYNLPIPNAKDFTLWEFIRDNDAIRLGIDNTPPPEAEANLIQLAVNVLQPLRDLFGPLRINSGYRCLALNKVTAGSSPKSHHIFGRACDFEPINQSHRLIDIAQYIDKNLRFQELILEYFPTGWIHVAYQDGEDGHVIKRKDNKHGYEVLHPPYNWEEL